MTTASNRGANCTQLRSHGKTAGSALQNYERRSAYADSQRFAARGSFDEEAKLKLVKTVW